VQSSHDLDLMLWDAEAKPQTIESGFTVQRGLWRYYDATEAALLIGSRQRS
jgi:hypothetical protein